MSSFKETHRLVRKSLRELFPSFSHRKSSTQSSNGEASTSVQQNMSSGSSRRGSSDAFTSCNRRRERQERQAIASQNGGDERRVRTPPEAPNTTIFQASVTQARAMNLENRAQLQARSAPSSDFGPYEEPNINDRRQLPFPVQQGVLFQMCKTLEGAIFDFTKRWAPGFLANKNLNSAQEIELNFWERYLATSVIPVEAFENRDDIPRYHELLDKFKEIRHTFVHRKKPPVLYVDQMLADAIEITKMIKDKTRAERLDEIHQVLHHMGSLLRNQVTIETKGILEDRLQANRRQQDMPMGWLEASRLKEEESEILRGLNHDNDVFAGLYARSLQALEKMMEPISSLLAG